MVGEFCWQNIFELRKYLHHLRPFLWPVLNRFVLAPVVPQQKVDRWTFLLGNASLWQIGHEVGDKTNNSNKIITKIEYRSYLDALIKCKFGVTCGINIFLLVWGNSSSLGDNVTENAINVVKSYLVVNFGINNAIADSLGNNKFGIFWRIKRQLTSNISKRNFRVRNWNSSYTSLDNIVTKSKYQSIRFVILEASTIIFEY